MENVLSVLSVLAFLNKDAAVIVDVLKKIYEVIKGAGSLTVSPSIKGVKLNIVVSRAS